MSQVIAVVSGKGGTGKTSFTTLTGMALAQLGKKTLLLDCDIGLRNLDLYLGVSDRALMDFTDVIAGRTTLAQAVVRHPLYPNLYLLTAPVSFGVRLPSKREMQRLIDEIRRHFDFCLIDAAAGIGEAFALATCCADPERQAVYQRAGCQVLCLNEENGHVDLRQLMERLGREQIDSILLEGGGTLNWAALECGIVQQVQAYIAPKLFGGRDAKTPVEGVGIPAPDDAFRLKNSRLERLGEDLLIESEVEYPCSQES